MTFSEESPKADRLGHARVLRIAMPILLANVTVPLLGAVDTAVVGQIPRPEPIAAVGVGAVILGAVYWIFGFLRMGTAGLTAQAVGQGDGPETAALLSRALLIGFVGGIALVILQGGVFQAAFYLSPAGPEVEALGLSYLQIRIWSAPAAIAMYGITGWLIAQERTRAVLVLQLWMNGANVLLDLVFVLQWGWGVQGVAWATFIAEWSGLIFGLWLCRDAFAHGHWRRSSLIFDLARLRRMAVVNGDILVRSLFLQAIFVSFLLYGGKFGDVTLAANQVLLQFLHVMAYALDGFAFAAETLVGQAVGAGAAARLNRAATLTSLWGFLCNLLFTCVFFLFGGMIIDVMTKDPQVQETARVYLPWVAIMPLVGLPSWMLDGIFIGATRTADMRNMMIVSAAIYSAAVYALMGMMGNHGLWVALMVSFAARGATLAIRYPALVRSVKHQAAA